MEIAKGVFSVEADSINNLSSQLTDDFDKAVRCISKSKGKLIVSGMGKSGIVGKKISATLASTGTPSFYLHPGEAYHGDLGMIEKNDIVLLISNSGETDELLKLIPFLQFQKNTVISMSGNPNSTLAKNVDFYLNVYVEKEACPLQLAPTSSTTAALAMGDALAVALMKLNNFKDENFAQFHPGGSLGKRLLTTVETVMIKNNLPTCDECTPIIDVVHAITNGKCGLVVVVDGYTVIGVITDGDIRRVMELQEQKFFDISAKDVMTKEPITIGFNEKIVKADEVMHSYMVNALPVVDSKYSLVGVVQLHDVSI